MEKRSGYRGYIGSREVRGEMTPQHVKNLVIRDYCQRNELLFKLSATEYAMPHCYLMLQSVLEELPSLEGIICFSLFMLPKSRQRRLEIYKTILRQGCSLHAALEGTSLTCQEDIQPWEDLILVDQSSQEQIKHLDGSWPLAGQCSRAK